MYEKEITRVASSELSSLLFGDTSKYKLLLTSEKEKLERLYPDSILDGMFNAIDSRIINICPMVLCDTMLSDLSVSCPDTLLVGIGLAMFSISTHDDLVDELPKERSVVAGLTYAGNISTLQGIKLLIDYGYGSVASVLIDCVNRNHYHQTKIVKTLWESPHDENGYLDAIKHTGYWVAIGLNAAIAYGDRLDLQGFVNEFSMCYGLTCQIFDDMREISDDVQNGYWSLPISTAKERGLDLSGSEGLNASISRPRQIAEGYLKRAEALCQNSFPRLLDLVLKMRKVGCTIKY